MMTLRCCVLLRGEDDDDHQHHDDGDIGDAGKQSTTVFQLQFSCHV